MNSPNTGKEGIFFLIANEKERLVHALLPHELSRKQALLWPFPIILDAVTTHREGILQRDYPAGVLGGRRWRRASQSPVGFSPSQDLIHAPDSWAWP